jgi:hypothetical protein
MLREIDIWLRQQAEKRYGPMENWRLIHWLIDNKPFAPIDEAIYRLRRAWELLRHG